MEWVSRSKDGLEEYILKHDANDICFLFRVNKEDGTQGNWIYRIDGGPEVLYASYAATADLAKAWLTRKILESYMERAQDLRDLLDADDIPTF